MLQCFSFDYNDHVSMNGKNNRWLRLRNNRLKFKTLGKLPIIFEEFREYT